MNTQESNSRLVSFSRGKQLVTIGDKFNWHDKKTYEVLSFNDVHLNYSPSGLGGAIGVNVKCLENGLIDEWCADSVASGIFTTNYNTHKK